MANSKAGVPQGSVLELLFFPIYFNGSSKVLPSSANIFSRDTSLCLKFMKVIPQRANLNHDLAIIKNWDCQWKIGIYQKK